MKVLYRKYRPTKLKDVLGQEQVVKPLENAIKSGKIGHAYLFTGPRGCGKTSVARIFAHEINGFPYEIEDNYIDIIEIDAASNTGVDNIRELREKAAIAPSKGKYKVYIIDEVHMLSKAAFNALLKTLEEPPRHVIFIMATTDAYKVPITITSRSQVFTFNLATPDVMQKHLETIAKKEKIAIEKDALEIIVRRGGGSFRDSISLLDQISALKSDGKITKTDIENALGLPEDAQIDDLLKSYKQGNAAEITNILENLLNSGLKPEAVAEDLLEKIIKNPEPTLLPLLETLPEVKNPFPEAKLLLAFLGKAAVQPVFAPITKNPTSTAKESQTPIESPQDAPEPAKTPEPTAVELPKAAQAAPSTPLDWPKYLEDIEKKSTAVASTLKKCQFSQHGNTVKIIPERKIYRTILESKNNLAILNACLPEGLALEFADQAELGPQFSQISAIMGGVQEVNLEDAPF